MCQKIVTDAATIGQNFWTTLAKQSSGSVFKLIGGCFAHDMLNTNEEVCIFHQVIPLFESSLFLDHFRTCCKDDTLHFRRTRTQLICRISQNQNNLRVTWLYFVSLPGRNIGRNFSGIRALTAVKISHRSRY